MPRDRHALRAALARLGLSQTRAAHLVGVQPRKLRAWCQEEDTTGHRQVPGPIWRILDMIETVPGALERLEALVRRDAMVEKVSSQ